MQNADSEFDFVLEAEVSDQALMNRFREGEQHAAEALYTRYARRLQQLASRQSSAELSRRVGPDEIVQSVFRTFFRRVSKGQYDAISGDDLWRLFLVMALNKIRSNANFHQAQKRDIRKTSLAHDDASATESFNRDDEVAYAVLKMTVDELLEKLDSGHAEIIRLRIHGHSLAEISKTTGRSLRTTERVLQKFRESLLKTVDG